jgi:mannosyltransferase
MGDRLRERASTAFRTIALAGFGAVITFGCVLRFWKLAATGLWYDELWTVVGALRPFMEIYREWILGDTHPPGYVLSYWVWLKIVPATEFWVRLPNAIAGVMTVLYLLFRTNRVLTRDERIMSAALASLSYIYIYYAVSVKQYSALLLLATVATINYLEIVEARRVERRTGTAFAAASVCMAYLTHFGMAYAGILLTLLALTFRHNREGLRRVIHIGIAFGIAYLPIAYFLYIQVAYSPGDWQPNQIESFVPDLLRSLFFDDPAYVWSAFGILCSFFVVLAITRQETRHTLGSSRNRHLTLIVLSSSSFMLALGTSKPIFHIRYFLIVFPALLIALGVVTAAVFPIRRGWLAILPLAFFFNAAVVQFRTFDRMQRQEWDKSVDFVLESRKGPEPVYVLGAKMDKTAFDSVREGNVNGVFFIRNVKFYEYYFRRRGADETAARLEVVEPTVESARALAMKFRGSGTTIYILAGHRIQYSDEALATLRQATHDIEITSLFSTIVYKVTF